MTVSFEIDGERSIAAAFTLPFPTRGDIRIIATGGVLGVSLPERGLQEVIRNREVQERRLGHGGGHGKNAHW